MADSGQITSKTGGQTRQIVSAYRTGISVPASGNTILLTIPVESCETMGVEVKPTVNALDAFIIEAKFHPGGDFVTLYSAAGDFTSPAGLVIGASGDLTALAAAATGWVILDTRGLYAVRISASGAADGTLVDIYAGGTGI